MLTRTIHKVLWNDTKAWEDANHLVHAVCTIFAGMGLQEPKFTSTLRIANRLKTQPRFHSRYHALRHSLSEKIQ